MKYLGRNYEIKYPHCEVVKKDGKVVIVCYEKINNR